MVDRIDAGEMPPGAADPTCHDYQGSDAAILDPRLPGALDAWIAAGKPAGDQATAAPYAVWTPPTPTRADVELYTAGAYTPRFVDHNEYRCFLIDDGVPADTWIAGLEFLIDDPRISHRALLFIDPDGGSDALVEDPASKSWPCSSVLPSPEWSLIHAWAPSGGALEFVIPAGDPSYTSTWSIDMFWLTFGLLSYDVRGVLPHMHVLGTGYHFWAMDPGGTEKCISRGDDYDFAMQPTYWSR
jgi:hypothetical protein